MPSTGFVTSLNDAFAGTVRSSNVAWIVCSTAWYMTLPVRWSTPIDGSPAS